MRRIGPITGAKGPGIRKRFGRMEEALSKHSSMLSRKGVLPDGASYKITTLNSPWLHTPIRIAKAIYRTVASALQVVPTFIFYPAADEATDGWGVPFDTLPLGTAGGNYRESLLMPRTDGGINHLRKYNNYAGLSEKNLRMGEGYHKYDWQSPNKEILSIWCYDANRYFGVNCELSYGIFSIGMSEAQQAAENKGEFAVDPTPHLTEFGPVVFFNGRRHAYAPNLLKITGMGLATWNDVRYLYIVCPFREYAEDLLDESFIVYRRVWKTTPYESADRPGDTYSAANPYGWQEVYTLTQQTYSAFTAAQDISKNLSGALGAAHFSPDGKKFVLSFRAFDKYRNARGDPTQWFAGYYEVVFSDGLTAVPTWNGNTYGIGPYVIAADYDHNNEVVELSWWVEDYSVSTGKASCRITTTEGNIDLCQAYSNAYGLGTQSFTSQVVGLDLRNQSLISLYRQTVENAGGSLIAEEYGMEFLKNGVYSKVPMETFGTLGTIPAVTDTVYSDGGVFYTGAFPIHFGLKKCWYDTPARVSSTCSYDYVEANILRSLYSGELLASFYLDWSAYIWDRDHGHPNYDPTDPEIPDPVWWNFYDGLTEEELNTALSINTYTEPRLLNRGVVALYGEMGTGLDLDIGYLDNLLLPLLDYPGKLGYLDAVRLNNGLVYSVPYGASYARFINPTTRKASISNTTYSGFYQQGVKLASGDVFLVPTLTTTQGAVWDYQADTVANVTGALPASADLISSVLMDDGNVLILVNEDLNSGATALYIYDTTAGSISASSVTFTSPDRFSWPVLLDNGTVYLVRYVTDGGFAKIYTPSTDSVVNAAAHDSAAAADFVRFGLLLPDGKVYMPPGIITGDARAQIYDPGADTTTALGIDNALFNFENTAYKAVNGPGDDYVTIPPNENGNPYFQVQRISTGNKFEKDDYLEGGASYFLSGNIQDYAAAVTLDNGANVFIGGGATEPMIYDTTSMRYLLHGFMGEGCCRDGVLLNDGRIFCGPGLTGEFVDGAITVAQPARARIYDPSSNTVVLAKGEFAGNSFGKTVLLPDGKVFLAPSWPPGSYLDTDYTAKIYDPVADAITTPFASPTFSASVAIPLSDGRVFMVVESVDQIWIYDAAIPDDKFTSSVSITTENFEDAVEMDDGRVFLVPADGATPAKIYDVVADSWASTGPTITGWHTAGALLNDGRVFCIPGPSGSSAFIYDPVEDTKVTPSGSYTVTHAYSDAVKLLDGRIFLVPYDETTAAIYDPYADELVTGLGNYASNYTGEAAYIRGVLMENGSVFCVPYNATTVRIFGQAYNRTPVDGSITLSGTVAGTSEITATLLPYVTQMSGTITGTSTITADLSPNAHTEMTKKLLSFSPVGVWTMHESSGNFSNTVSPGSNAGVPSGTITYNSDTVVTSDAEKGPLLGNSASVSASGLSDFAQPFSVAIWIKPVAQSGTIDLFEKKRSSGDECFEIEMGVPSGGNVTFRFRIWTDAYSSIYIDKTVAEASSYFVGFSKSPTFWYCHVNGSTSNVNSSTALLSQSSTDVTFAKMGASDTAVIEYAAVYETTLSGFQFYQIWLLGR